MDPPLEYIQPTRRPPTSHYYHPLLLLRAKRLIVPSHSVLECRPACSCADSHRGCIIVAAVLSHPGHTASLCSSQISSSHNLSTWLMVPGPQGGILTLLVSKSSSPTHQPAKLPQSDVLKPISESLGLRARLSDDPGQQGGGSRGEH